MATLSLVLGARGRCSDGTRLDQEQTQPLYLQASAQPLCHILGARMEGYTLLFLGLNPSFAQGSLLVLFGTRYSARYQTDVGHVQGKHFDPCAFSLAPRSCFRARIFGFENAAQYLLKLKFICKVKIISTTQFFGFLGEHTWQSSAYSWLCIGITLSGFREPYGLNPC